LFGGMRFPMMDARPDDEAADPSLHGPVRPGREFRRGVGRGRRRAVARAGATRPRARVGRLMGLAPNGSKTDSRVERRAVTDAISRIRRGVVVGVERGGIPGP
jgi:hypothetical protein